jgi:hypothetical protein
VHALSPSAWTKTPLSAETFHRAVKTPLCVIAFPVAAHERAFAKSQEFAAVEV